MQFPVIVCLIGAISFFFLAAKLRGFKVPEAACVSRRTHLGGETTEDHGSNPD